MFRQWIQDMGFAMSVTVLNLIGLAVIVVLDEIVRKVRKNRL